jgi:hypothetical protein
MTRGDGGAGEVVSLPLVVTEHFSRQGWFADASLAGFFGPGSTIIRQGVSGVGACAARVLGARGGCQQIVYVPPADLAPPAAGGWVGSYFLAPLREDHPQETPPLRAGEGNWGIEPGARVAAGASRVSFYAAVDGEPVAVSFRVGSERDGFVLPEQTVQVTSTWVRYTIAFAGARYERVVTPFAWLLKDTSTAARFYLDDIVWEAAE